MVKIWWTNSIFFITAHIAAFLCAYYWPPYVVKRASFILCIMVWQLADFGITIGYHRLYSHRAFRARFGVRVVLALLGASAFQGSIKWWCLRHRLHHRYTDDPVHDPYSATRGLFYSHMGWIFFKPKYEKMNLIDREDLESDPVVQFQHRYYIPLALSCGFIVPACLGFLWDDVWGAFVWGGLVSRLLIWHCTFLVNSLAHWDGLQPYSDEDTSRGNLILAFLTGGEGNHNFHAFPQDFRSGPAILDWDPSKWIILVLHYFGLVTGLRRARDSEMYDAMKYLHMKKQGVIPEEYGGRIDVWKRKKLYDYVIEKPGRCVVVLDGFVVDVTSYMGEHPGGASLLRKLSVRAEDDNLTWLEATWAFNGGLNQHSRAANRQMQRLAVARLEIQ